MLSPKEVVNKWVDAFNDGDVDMIISLYDNNATNYQVANEPVVGVVAIREMFGDLKKELAESVNSLIDRMNKR